jgi:2-keto-myo-inositol isomerase
MKACYNGATSRPYPLEEDLRAASAAGFPMVELWGEKFEKFFADHTVDELRGLLEQFHLRPAAIDLVALDYSEPQNVETAVARAHYLGNIARQIHCDLLLLCAWGDLHGRSKEEGIALVAEYIQPVCKAAAEHGCRIAIEPLGRHALIPGCQEALAIIAEAGQPNLGLMWDFFHYYKSEVPLDAIRAIPNDRLWLVHVDDAPAKAPAELSDPDRVYLGLGEMPLATYFAILREKGYNGPLSVELFNKSYYERPIDEITRNAYRSLQPYLAAGAATGVSL